MQLLFSVFPCISGNDPYEYHQCFPLGPLDPTGSQGQSCPTCSTTFMFSSFKPGAQSASINLPRWDGVQPICWPTCHFCIRGELSKGPKIKLLKTLIALRKASSVNGWELRCHMPVLIVVAVHAEQPRLLPIPLYRGVHGTFTLCPYPSSGWLTWET